MVAPLLDTITCLMVTLGVVLAKPAAAAAAELSPICDGRFTTIILLPAVAVETMPPLLLTKAARVVGDEVSTAAAAVDGSLSAEIVSFFTIVAVTVIELAVVTLLDATVAPEGDCDGGGGVGPFG